MKPNIASEALSNYHLSNPQAEFIRESENIVFSVKDGSKRYALRIRRPASGFDLSLFNAGMSPAELFAGEMEILRRLGERAPFPVQKPVPASDGSLFCILSDGSPAALMEWIDGKPMGSDPDGKYARQMGVLAAQIHKALDGMNVKRPAYSHSLIKSMTAELENACAAGHITPEHKRICTEASMEINRVMTELDAQPGMQSVIHADLSPGNILITPHGIAPIDFSLSGIGYKPHECGMIASCYNDPALWQAVADGYAEESGITLDPHHVDAFFAMSVLLFITAQHNRFGNDDWFPDAMDRWCKECFGRITR